MMIFCNEKVKKVLLLPIFVILLLFSYPTYSESNMIDKTQRPVYHETVSQKLLTERIESVKVGETIIFGRYEQDNILDYGPEDLEWCILRRDEKHGKATLITKYIIDSMRFNGFGENVTWETSSLRLYMNNELIYHMFTEEEISCIEVSQLKNHPNLFHGTYSGEDTEDKIYIPSMEDIYNFFGNDNFVNEAKYLELLRPNIHRMAKATPYAIARGCRVTNKNSKFPGNGNYWLRTAGLNGHRIWYNEVYADYFQSFISEIGELKPDGTGINSCDDGIRIMVQVHY